MLIDFTVSNFRSIKEPQTLSMLATGAKENPHNVFKVDDKINLLKTAVIYGANGSGKSNVVKALEAMTLFVHYSTDYKKGDRIEHYQSFKLDKSYTVKPITFELEFIGSDSIRYKYLFSFTEFEIVSESLAYFPKNQEVKLFIREKGKRIFFGESLKGNKKNIEAQLLPNQLFLSKAANNNNEHLGLVYASIGNTFTISSSLSDAFVNFTANEIDQQNEKRLGGTPLAILSSILKQADTGVESILFKLNEKFQDANHPDDKWTSTKYDIKTVHKLYEREIETGVVTFDLADESEGTQKLFGLGGQIISLLEMGSIVVIDELNNSFHPLITETIIKLFQNPETNPKNAQLIFTTHDTSVLKPELFRRDQIWFTEKDKFGATSLYSLSEFEYDKVRTNIPFDKWYLSGRFGALPLIQDFKLATNAEATEGE